MPHVRRTACLVLHFVGLFWLMPLAMGQQSFAADDGTWAPLAPASPPSVRMLHTAINDPVRDRMIVYGGWTGGDSSPEVWALSLAGAPVWSNLDVPINAMTARSAHTSIYDPVGDRMVVFGGTHGIGFNDVWELSLAGSPVWNEITPAGGPAPPRSEHTAIYDSAGVRMVVFGGLSIGGYSNEVWALSLAGTPAWTQLTPTGGPPPTRSGHTAIYDPVGERMVVFGGANDTGYLSDVWALSLAGSPAWTQLTPAGGPPPARSGHTAIYDRVRQRMVIFGGLDGNATRNDTWALSLTGEPAWTALSPSGTLPLTREWHTSIYDRVRDRMVVFGGHNGDASILLNDVRPLWWGPVTSVPGDHDVLSGRFKLAPPRPSPSRGETTLEFTLGNPAHIVLDVIDTQGRRVRRIADDWFPAGRQFSTWTGDDDLGNAVSNGIYFIRMQAGNFRVTQRAVLIH